MAARARWGEGHIRLGVALVLYAACLNAALCRSTKRPIHGNKCAWEFTSPTIANRKRRNSRVLRVWVGCPVRTGRFSLCMGWFSKTFTQHALSRGILQVLMGYERGAASMNGFNAFGAQVGGSRPAKQQDVSSLLRDVTPLGSRAAANANDFSPERLAEIAEN